MEWNLKAPPVYLTEKTRELLRLMAADPVMQKALAVADAGNRFPATAMLRVSTMGDADWQILEDKYRVV